MSETVAVTGPNGLTFQFPKDTAEGLLRHSDIGEGTKTPVVEVDGTDRHPLIANANSSEDIKRAASTDGFNPRREGGTAEGSAVTNAAAKGDGKPAGNASRDDWYAYALANGKTGADLDGLKQGEIRALFSE